MGVKLTKTRLFKKFQLKLILKNAIGNSMCVIHIMYAVIKKILNSRSNFNDFCTFCRNIFKLKLTIFTNFTHFDGLKLLEILITACKMCILMLTRIFFYFKIKKLINNLINQILLKKIHMLINA